MARELSKRHPCHCIDSSVLSKMKEIKYPSLTHFCSRRQARQSRTTALWDTVLARSSKNWYTTETILGSTPKCSMWANHFVSSLTLQLILVTQCVTVLISMPKTLKKCSCFTANVFSVCNTINTQSNETRFYKFPDLTKKFSIPQVPTGFNVVINLNHWSYHGTKPNSTKLILIQWVKNAAISS